MNTQEYMSRFKRFYWVTLAALSVAASIRPGFADEALSRKDRQTGFLVVAADRGFIGNEEIIDEFQLFAKTRNAALIFVTDERTGKYLRNGLDRLLKKGAERIVVIPLFISAAAPRYELARELLDREKLDVPVSYTRPYGESYFAVEDLVDKFRIIPQPADTNLIVAGFGAVDSDSERKMRADWKRIAENAAAGFGFASIRVLIGHDKEGNDDAESRTARLKRELAASADDERDGSRGGRKTVVVPFHLGPKLDSMMSFDARLNGLLPPGAQLLADGNSDTRVESGAVASGLAIWLRREANRSQPFAREDIGVVILSHGSDFNWNETMREAVQPLMKRYKIEFAFSMADQPTIERALRKLEQRGAKVAVVVRVFAMEQSFRKDIERMTGLDIEEGAHDIADVNTGHGRGHYGMTAVTPAPRIRTLLPIQTVGGLGASPLFATALLERARALSKNPVRDTVILVAHGSGSDHQNELWTKALEDIARQMREADGKGFHAIRVATWREDWPDKRAPWVGKIRTMVEDAKKEGGRAIVIPARTTGQGPEDKFLSGLEYDLGSGFAPHPMFVQWVDEQVRAGLARFAGIRRAGTTTAAEADGYASSSEKWLWW